MSSVEHRPSTIAVASILIARGKEETPAGNLDALKAILGSSCPHLDTVSPSSRAVPSSSRVSFGRLLAESAMMSNKCSRCSCLAGACVLLLQRDDSGGRQVADALDVDGGGVLGRLCRARWEREPRAGRLRVRGRQ